MDNLERDIYIERQDPDLAARETPEQTRARLIKMYQDQPQEPQGYDSGAIQFSKKSFDTRLTPSEEQQFGEWKQKYAPMDSGADYDLRGAYKAGLTPDPTSGHWPDSFKKPNHPTFSIESKYAKDAPDKAGSWGGPNRDQYIPAGSSIQKLTELMQTGSRPRISQPNYLEQLLQRIRQ